MQPYQWLVYNLDTRQLEKQLDIEPVCLKILANRKISEPTQIQRFLNPTLSDFHDPFLMTDMEVAVDMILEAMEEEKHIHIVGDYDQDGNSATVALMKGLQRIYPKVTYAIPDRMEDGYGMSIRIVDVAKENQVDLIITCDNGISAFDSIDHAVDLGIDVIVTDHHMPVRTEEGLEKLPSAHAVLNPHREGDAYPFKELCGAGVAFKLLQAAYETLGEEMDKLYELLEFIAMGTVCDVVDLVDENRLIVIEGLKRLNQTTNKGIRALLRENTWNRPVDVYTLGFILGPCINASGRLSTARLGVELFLEEDDDRIDLYARELVELNTARKGLTEVAVNRAKDLVLKNSVHKNKTITLYLEDTHESIVGIVAGRLKELFYRPVFVYTNAQEEGVLKASARSIEEYDMIEHLHAVKDLMIRYGGHKMAAGMSIASENLPDFQEQIEMGAGLSESDLMPKIVIDAAVDLRRIDENFIAALNRLMPYGKGNPTPVLADKQVEVLSASLIGKNRNVLKLMLKKGDVVIEGIHFARGEAMYDYLLRKFGVNELVYKINETRSLMIDVVYFPQINEFRGNRTIQLKIIDIR